MQTSPDNDVLASRAHFRQRILRYHVSQKKSRQTNSCNRRYILLRKITGSFRKTSPRTAQYASLAGSVDLICQPRRSGTMPAWTLSTRRDSSAVRSRPTDGRPTHLPRVEISAPDEIAAAAYVSPPGLSLAARDRPLEVGGGSTEVSIFVFVSGLGFR
jgi:hypothetical protein